MRIHKADFTNFFLALTYRQTTNEAIFQADGFKNWHQKWEHRLKEENNWEKAHEMMRSQKPCNHTKKSPGRSGISVC
jgi:uncharacterized protein YdiU (UPF0061 family)